MTPEEMEKAIHFVIEQQAQFAASIQQLTEKHAALADATIGNTGMIGRILKVLDRITEEHVKLAEAQARTESKIAELTVRIDGLAVRLDAFIVTVERYISERRNGKGES